MKKESDYELIKVVMNDGIVVDLKNRQAKFLKEYYGINNVIIYSTDETDVKESDKKKSRL